MKTLNKWKGMLLGLVAVAISPHTSFAQAPNLGTASTFGIFTTIGAISNVSFTVVNGDMGTDAGAVSGFPPGIVNGQIHVADPVSAQVAADVETAYNFIAGLSCGIALGNSIGNGQTLTPNVYCLTPASALDGNLTLDGQGDANALFIIKVDGALIASSFSNVTLINSASFCNVYWHINGAFDLGDGSVFGGTLIANGAISLLDGATIDGRMLTRQGAISPNNNAITVVCPTVMPITLTAFSAEIVDAQTTAMLHWETAYESNSGYFLIERSTDGIEYQTLGERDAAGFSNHTIHYTFADEYPVLGLNYYRLNQFDLNGTQEYAQVLVMDFSPTAAAVRIYPNPFTTAIDIAISDISRLPHCVLNLYNAWGQDVLHATLTASRTTVDVSHLAPGIYYSKVTGNGKTIHSGKMIAH